MFDFEKLEVYKKAKAFHIDIGKLLANYNLDRTTKDQLKRASMSITLNIAEGTSRFSKADQRNFFVIARGSLMECIAILDILQENHTIESNLYNTLYLAGEELSKMLFAYIKRLQS